jgi:hypothetical protein
VVRAPQAEVAVANCRERMHVEAAEYNEMWHITEFLFYSVPLRVEIGAARRSAARVTGVLHQSEGRRRKDGGSTQEAGGRRKQPLMSVIKLFLGFNSACAVTKKTGKLENWKKFIRGISSFQTFGKLQSRTTGDQACPFYGL